MPSPVRMLPVHLLFSDRDPVASQKAKEAVEAAFGEVSVVEEGSVDAAMIHGTGEGCSLMILIQPEMQELELVLKCSQHDSAARWPVVSLGQGIRSSSLAVIPPEDWHVPLLVQVLHAAVQKHELLRENARLRGDLLTFARRVSHDLRSPLSGIFTTAELLKEILAEQSPEDAALTTPLFESSQAVLKLIERTSQVAKASVETHPALEQVDMGQAQWAGRQVVEQKAAKAGVRLQEPEQWPTVVGVSAWLEIVWANLLNFAVQRSPRGATVQTAWQETPETYEFSVTDQGSPLTAEQQAAQFWPFEKLHQGHSSKSLDLPIARRFIELQGGRCDCESAAGGGLRCSFTLPKAPVSAPVAAPRE